jgi:hippurate hydrolase
VTVNDGAFTAFARGVAADLLGDGSVVDLDAPIMGAEDFSYVLQKTPGAMLVLGVCPEGQQWKMACPCHSNRMVLNESMLARGVAAHCAIAERFLANGFD